LTQVELINGESLTSVEDMLQIVWPLLLARAASDSQVADGSLNQMLKDAHDNGVSHPEVPHESDNAGLSVVFFFFSIPRIGMSFSPMFLLAIFQRWFSLTRINVDPIAR